MKNLEKENVTSLFKPKNSETLGVKKGLYF